MMRVFSLKKIEIVAKDLGRTAGLQGCGEDGGCVSDSTIFQENSAIYQKSANATGERLCREEQNKESAVA